MRSRGRGMWLAAVCAAVLLAGCAGSDGGDAPDGPPAGPGGDRGSTTGGIRVVGIEAFQRDLQVLTRTAQALGGSLTRAASSGAQLREEAPTFGLLRSRIESSVARMGGYRVDVAFVEAQRSRIVLAAPALADSLGRAEEVARAGDVETFRALLPQLVVSLQITFGSLGG